MPYCDANNCDADAQFNRPSLLLANCNFHLIIFHQTRNFQLEKKCDKMRTNIISYDNTQDIECLENIMIVMRINTMCILEISLNKTI